MPSPLTVKRNEYRINPKSSTIYTPDVVADFLFTLLKDKNYHVVLDPAIGKGQLTNRFRENGAYIIGCDIDRQGKECCDLFFHTKFEEFDKLDIPVVDLVICNPPFNQGCGRKMYPEVFLKKIVEFFGPNIPVVLFTPMGFRLNQRKISARWRWLQENIEISSILSLPLDIFDGVQFHNEVLFFNISGIKPHYFLGGL